MSALRDSMQRRAAEQLRRGSARATEQIALRCGHALPMCVGGGYSKSGTVWLCQTMSHYLGVPYPQNYALPVAMRAVVHAHWPYDARLPQTAYIVRDGRDVTVSLYFHEMRALTLDRNSFAVAQRRKRYERIFGAGFDPAEVRANLPRFLRAELAEPRALRGVTWGQHVQEWTAESVPDVSVVTYEDLLEKPGDAFGAPHGRCDGGGGRPRASRARGPAFRFRAKWQGCRPRGSGLVHA